MSGFVATLVSVLHPLCCDSFEGEVEGEGQLHTNMGLEQGEHFKGPFQYW